MPPALIQTAQFDVLRDEGEAYGHRLDQAGNDGSTSQYKGTIHDFGLLNILAADARRHATDGERIEDASAITRTVPH